MQKQLSIMKQKNHDININERQGPVPHANSRDFPPVAQTNSNYQSLSSPPQIDRAGINISDVGDTSNSYPMLYSKAKHVS